MTRAGPAGPLSLKGNSMKSTFTTNRAAEAFRSVMQQSAAVVLECTEAVKRTYFFQYRRTKDVQALREYRTDIRTIGNYALEMKEAHDAAEAALKTMGHLTKADIEAIAEIHWAGEYVQTVLCKVD